MLETIDSRWTSLQEVCDCLNVKRYTIMRWIRQRIMPASKIGKLCRLRISDIDEWVNKGGAVDGQEVLQ